jgi:MinD superfamily P-loop ATPase
MKQLAVISGKGGTGKTSLVAAFAALARDKVLADCDVDAADLHLVLRPRATRREPFRAGHIASIRQDECIACGACLARCRYDAVRREGNGAGEARFTVDPLACEGCGVCVWSCPTGAVEFTPRLVGQWFVSETRHGPMVHARLGIAQENSGKLVTLVRREAVRLARERGLKRILIDGPPGIGCPVIASIGGASRVLIVTEPTLSGLHDLGRVAELAAHFRQHALVCINKADINPDVAGRIREACDRRGIRLAGEIPYDPAVTHAQVRGRSIVEHPDGPAARAVAALWDNVAEALEESPDA